MLFGTLKQRSAMRRIAAILFCFFSLNSLFAQQQKPLAVIAYYAGSDTAEVDRFDATQLTHIIFSFCHLKGAQLSVDNAADSMMIKKLVQLKKKVPAFKVMLSLGGWGGCASCSEVFSSAANRKVFAESVKALNEYFGTDGLDLDWEYPAIQGFPGHVFQASDKQNFTALVQQLRQTLGAGKIISFAAGGFASYIEQAIEWREVMKEVDFVNLMTYDLVNGYATTTGHHTPLYATPRQTNSVDEAVKQLLKLNVKPEKIVIGGAFYGRMWEQVPDINNGLYQPGKFKASIGFEDFSSWLSADSGFVYHWDSVASAPYLYNPKQQLFVTFDDRRSIALKTRYALDRGLGGIMFWELTNDLYHNGLLEAIDKAKGQYNK
jgi:chitinase